MPAFLRFDELAHSCVQDIHERFAIAHRTRSGVPGPSAQLGARRSLVTSFAEEAPSSATGASKIGGGGEDDDEDDDRMNILEEDDSGNAELLREEDEAKVLEEEGTGLPGGPGPQVGVGAGSSSTSSSSSGPGGSGGPSQLKTLFEHVVQGTPHAFLSTLVHARQTAVKAAHPATKTVGALRETAAAKLGLGLEEDASAETLNADKDFLISALPVPLRPYARQKLGTIRSVVCGNQEQLLANPVVRNAWLTSGVDPDLQAASENNACGRPIHYDEVEHYMRERSFVPPGCKEYLLEAAASSPGRSGGGGGAGKSAGAPSTLSGSLSIASSVAKTSTSSSSKLSSSSTPRPTDVIDSLYESDEVLSDQDRFKALDEIASMQEQIELLKTDPDRFSRARALCALLSREDLHLLKSSDMTKRMYVDGICAEE
ncbi:unnamed protein product, partial [Amoebophrya sp. A25]|eukprot:GSA25T00019328001.1